MVSPGNAWEMESFDGEIGRKGRENRDKYFDRTDEGHYKLKDGYEQRYLGGSGNSLGAEMTYTTDWDDDDDRKHEHYGIFKKAEPKTVYKDKPSEPATAPSKPIVKSTEPVEYEYSPEIIQAQKNVDDYKEKVKTGAISRSIYRSPESEQAAQSFLDMKKYQFMAK